MERFEKYQIFRSKIGGKKLTRRSQIRKMPGLGLKNFLSSKACLGYDGERVILFVESVRTKHHPSWEGL